MKLIPFIGLFALIGVGLGFAIAYVEVGEVESSLYGPVMGDQSPAKSIPEESYPSAEVDAALHDFGTMQRGTTASHEFIIKNTGDAPLRLEVGATSCKCTLGNVSRGPLAPGDTTPVRLEWVAKTIPGKFRQTASVLTNDPRRPKIELVVEGLVTETTGIAPNELLVGRMASDEKRSASVYIGAYEDQVIEATARMSNTTLRPELFDVKVEPVAVDETPLERATSAVKLTVSAGPGLPMGHVTEWVEVTANIKGKTVDPASDSSGTLLIPFLAIVEGDVAILGSGWVKGIGVLNIGKIKSTEGKTAKLRVAFKGEHAEGAEVTLGRVDPEWLDVQVGEPQLIREGVTHVPLTVSIPPGRPSVIRSGDGAEAGGQGDGDARLQLLTNHPTTPELDVRVRFVVAE